MDPPADPEKDKPAPAPLPAGQLDSWTVGQLDSWTVGLLDAAGRCVAAEPLCKVACVRVPGSILAQSTVSSCRSAVRPPPTRGKTPINLLPSL